MLLRSAKVFVTRLAERLGLSAYFLNSPWRRSRVLILCYHGVSLADEHQWLPGLYVSPGLFRQRLERLRDLQCAVLPLAEAVERLQAGTLPRRAVVITFDDGFFDFFQEAWPILKEFSFPATVYLTTYYSQHPWPVFDLMLEYLLWKASARELQWPGILDGIVRLDPAGRQTVAGRCRAHAFDSALSGKDKDQLLSDLAVHAGVDLEALRQRRILHLMNAAEVRTIAAQGADIQLHTHRHRLFPRRERFWREIDENRHIVEDLSDRAANHFCYPGGLTRPEFPSWLRERGVTSATTCDTGIASPKSNPLLLPRLLDTNLPNEEFDLWLTGFAAFIPRRTVTPSQTQLGVERFGDA